MLPTKPPLPESPLGRALAANAAASAPPPPKPVARHASGLSRKPPVDQPVTFHRKVASSGYGQPPVRATEWWAAWLGVEGALSGDNGVRSEPTTT